MKIDNRNRRYNRIDGLRATASAGIVYMHVLANSNFNLQGFVALKLIPSFTNLVFLFMMISSFSLCCGYYEEITSGEVSLANFYKKRFKKTWPFFALLCLLEFIYAPSLNTLFEVLANLTLAFGFIPNHGIEVIGVGWFLGLVFVFYFLFPFFCYLLSSKKRAWVAFGICVLLNYLCRVYFEAGQESMAYSAVFFMAGGMIFLYRDILSAMATRREAVLVSGIVLLACMYFVVGQQESIMLLLYSIVLIYALGEVHKKFDLLSNRITKRLSRVSLEVYLSHMFIFRVIHVLFVEQMKVLPDGIEMALTGTMTLLGAIVFAIITQKLFAWCKCVLPKCRIQKEVDYV